jgi:hypothetical protein
LRENFRAWDTKSPKGLGAPRDGPGDPKEADADPGKEPPGREFDLPPDGNASEEIDATCG